MKISKRGQVIIPKNLRDKYGLQSGLDVDFVPSGNGIRIVKRGNVQISKVSAEDKWSEWTKWEKLIHDEVVGLHWRRCIYNHLGTITDSNSDLTGDQDLLSWMFANYAWAQVMTLRRLVAPSKDVDNGSLHTLLTDLKNNCHLLTWENVVAFWSGQPIVTQCRLEPGTSRKEDLRMHSLQRMQRKGFDIFHDLAGVDAESIEATALDQKLKVLDGVQNRIGQFVNRSLAHLDKRGVQQVPTMADLDKMIDTAIDVFHFVHRVMTGAPKAALPKDDQRWDWALEFAWKIK